MSMDDGCLPPVDPCNVAKYSVRGFTIDNTEITSLRDN